MAHRYADYDDDDDDPFDERGLLKDGRTSRTSLMMKDGLSDVQRSIAQDAVSRRFDDSAARHQLGPIYFDRSAAREAYEDARRESEQAWKMLPTPTEAADRRKRKVTTRDPFGRESGTWEEDAASDAAPVGPTYDVAERRRRKQAAYDAMVADLTGLAQSIAAAWRYRRGTARAPGCCARAAHHDR